MSHPQISVESPELQEAFSWDPEYLLGRIKPHPEVEIKQFKHLN